MKLLLGCDAVRYPLTGVGRYAFELARGMKAQAELEVLRYFIGASVHEYLPDPHLSGMELTKADASRSVKLALLKSDAVVSMHRIVKGFFQRRALKPFTGYVYHGPNYYLPQHDGPCVSTFHDLSMYKHASFHPEARVRYMEAELPLALKRADVLITDCDYIRREVIEYSGFAPSRVLAIPLAASEGFSPRGEDECRVVLNRYGLTYGRFALFAGTIEPRKNIAGLLDAYERLPHALRILYPLVLAGYRGWKSEELHDRIQNAERAGWVRYLGFVPDVELPLLFAAARTFAFPSYYEGFGLPVLEAMASGVPVVCSDASSLPEASGGCALSCAPDDNDALVALLARALEDVQWREGAIVSGLAHARTFSWQRVVNETIQAYRMAEAC